MRKKGNTDASPMTWKAAAVLALAISLIMHLFFVVMLLHGRGAMPSGENDFAAAVNLRQITISFSITFTTAFILYLINFRLLRLDVSAGLKVLLITVCTLSAAVFLNWLVLYVSIEWLGLDRPFKMAFRGGVSRDAFISLIIILSSYLFNMSHRRQQIALEYESLKNENLQTRYEALKNQVDPHFLFNSLNTLNAIILTDPKKAQEYVQQLSAVFRYTLQNREVIILEGEIRFSKAYCALMELRYGGSLEIVFDIDDRFSKYLITPISIQTLIENAIKHNIADKKQPLVVSIRTDDEGSRVTVSNPVRPRKNREESEGVGLVNLSERNRIMWNKDIEISNTDGIFSVSIPLIKPS